MIYFRKKYKLRNPGGEDIITVPHEWVYNNEDKKEVYVYLTDEMHMAVSFEEITGEGFYRASRNKHTLRAQTRKGEIALYFVKVPYIFYSFHGLENDDFVRESMENGILYIFPDEENEEN